jgi:hypothetical protein
MREHIRSGLEVARYLEKHPAVTKVLHPTLPTHPDHELAMKQHKGLMMMLLLLLLQLLLMVIHLIFRHFLPKMKRSNIKYL